MADGGIGRAVVFASIKAVLLTHRYIHPPYKVFTGVIFLLVSLLAMLSVFLIPIRSQPDTVISWVRAWLCVGPLVGSVPLLLPALKGRVFPKKNRIRGMNE